MGTFSNSLVYNQLNEISLQCNANEIIIYVSNVELGRIQQLYPVSVYVEITNGIKKIWIKEISQKELMRNNLNLPDRTIYFNQNHPQANLHLEKCNSSGAIKIVGWEDEATSGICGGNLGCTSYFNIHSYLNFKAKIEPLITNGLSKNVLCVRYEIDVVHACDLTMICDAGLYCYSCI